MIQFLMMFTLECFLLDKKQPPLVGGGYFGKVCCRGG